ncbi:MAG: enhanced intracellular survival protein Eis [Anaerolineae bacterium]
MREIRPLATEEFPLFSQLSANAYPAFNMFSPEAQERSLQRMRNAAQDPIIQYYGVWDGAELLGGMRFFDFTMQMLSAPLLVGGVGGVAVSLTRKKEKVARDMILFFLRHYREKGAALTALYPFRPDFYRRMGFGYGAQMNQYRLKPDSLPTGGSKRHITFLAETDVDALNDCYNRVMAKTHGMIAKHAYRLETTFGRPGVKIVGYKIDGRIHGYLVFTFEKKGTDTFLQNNLVVREFVYENREVLAELLAFLRTQADQIDRIEFNTQDDAFHFLLSGRLLPTVWHESNAQGIGIMYRVIDVAALFTQLAAHNFNGVSCRLKLTVADSFLPENDGSTVIRFENGRAHPQPDSAAFDVEISLDIADFSSLVMGTVNFKRLYTYSLAEISDEGFVNTINQLFAAPKPICMTNF